jgi:hypothetical protein
MANVVAPKTCINIRSHKTSKTRLEKPERKKKRKTILCMAVVSSRTE